MEVKSENANNSCSNEGQKTLSFPIIPPVVLSHIASNKLDGFKYAADDMMLKNRKLFSFSDDFSISYHVESPTRNVKKFISDGMNGKTFKWDPKTLSLMIGIMYNSGDILYINIHIDRGFNQITRISSQSCSIFSITVERKDLLP